VAWAFGRVEALAEYRNSPEYAEISKRGFDGKKLFDSAKSLIDKHNKRT
jgi:hypothetical protein